MRRTFALKVAPMTNMTNRNFDDAFKKVYGIGFATTAGLT